MRSITATAVWGEPRSSCTIIQVLSASPKLLLVPGGLQGQLLWQTLTVPLMQLWEVWVGAGFCQRDVFRASWGFLRDLCLGLPSPASDPTAEVVLTAGSWGCF